MAKKEEDKKVNELEHSLAGCYGEHVTHEKLEEFLEFNFDLNRESEENGQPRFATCIWGWAGIGKTAEVKSYRNKKVKWKGQETSWHVADVPVAQFEEMGDLHGLPMKCSLLRNPEDGEERWVPVEYINDYEKIGWKLDTSVMPRTHQAPPDWVPQKPGPSILLLDDWNRASVRIIKGIMQLLQNYGMVSWKLPPGCNIVLTGNPDMQDYLVTSLDSAILTRIKHITLLPDAKEWCVWATRQDLDPRGINFILKYPDMMKPANSNKMTNPRTLAEYFRVTKKFATATEKNDVANMSMHGKSLIDDETFSAFITFAAKENEALVEPDEILTGTQRSKDHIKNLMQRTESRVDVLNIICERLYAHIINPATKQDETKIKNFQTWITMECIPEDTRDSLCRRIAKQRVQNAQRWLLGHTKLRDLILTNLH